MSVMMEKFIVLDVKGFSGLLVSDYVYKPGRVFYRNEWKWGDEVISAAIKSGRCKILEQTKVEVAKTDNQPIITDEKSEKQLKLESMLEEYSTLDSGSNKAKKLEEKIKILETEIINEANQ
jgi:hypothetical protein